MMAVSYKASTFFLRFIFCKRLNNCHRLFNTLSPSISITRGKKYVESENEFAHQVLARLPQYKNSMAYSFFQDLSSTHRPLDQSNIDWESLSVTELSDTFKSVSLDAKENSSQLGDQRFKSMCSVIAERCTELADENLLVFLNCLSLWSYTESPKETNFYGLWKALDNACLNRWKKWNIDQILLFTDSWYATRLTRMSDFVYISMTKTAMNPNRLQPHQLVQLLFYLNVLRKLSKSIAMYEIEYQLERVVRHLSTEELGVATMGFYKTQNVIHSEKLLEHIIDRIIKDADTIPEITVASLLKVLRGSLQISIWDRIPELLDALELQINRFSLQCVVHINLLASKALTFHEGTLSKTSQKLVDSINEARLKDIEKVLFPVTYLNFNPQTTPCLFETVVKEIIDPNRVDEFEKYPKSLIAVIYYLTLRDILVERAAAKVLDMGFLRKTYGRTNYMIGREVLGLDVYLDIKHPSYEGPRLPVPVRNYLSKRYSTFVPDPKWRLSKHAKFTLEVFQTSQELLGNNCIVYKYLVPHHSRADIVFHLNPQGEPLPIPEYYRNIENFTGPIKAPDDGGTWFSLVIASRNMFIHKLTVVTGETSSKLDLLRTLGYKPIMVSFWDWINAGEDKLAYLNKLIYS